MTITLKYLLVYSRSYYLQHCYWAECLKKVMRARKEIYRVNKMSRPDIYTYLQYKLRDAMLTSNSNGKILLKCTPNGQEFIVL
jgi:hypothetical protein